MWAIKNTPIPSHYTSWLIGFPILWLIIIPSKPGRIKSPFSQSINQGILFMAHLETLGETPGELPGDPLEAPSPGGSRFRARRCRARWRSVSSSSGSTLAENVGNVDHTYVIHGLLYHLLWRTNLMIFECVCIYIYTVYIYNIYIYMETCICVQ